MVIITSVGVPGYPNSASWLKWLNEANSCETGYRSLMVSSHFELVKRRSVAVVYGKKNKRR